MTSYSPVSSDDGSTSSSSPLAWQSANRSSSSSNRMWIVGAAFASVLALTYFSHSTTSSDSVAYSSSSTLATTLAPSSDPHEPCRRTLVLDWDTWSIGIGSGLMTLNGAAVWAESNGYEVLLSQGKNNYGYHSEYFETPVPTCKIPADQNYDVWKCMDGKDGCDKLFNRTTGERLTLNFPERTALGVWSLYPVNPVNKWLSTTAFDFKSLEGLPDYNSQKPLPLVLSVPPAMQPAFELMQASFNRRFKLNAGMEQLVADKAKLLDLDAATKSRVPVVGVHFRGGDKLVYECHPTSKMSCANVTLHIEGAKLQLDAALKRSTYLPSSPSSKPKLVLLTAEQDAFANFTKVNDEAFGGLFEIVKAPAVAPEDGTKLQSFKQSNFNGLPLEARIADTRDLLSNVAMLARRADGFVVSANTNIGRVAALMSTRPMAVSNLDFWWHPTLYLLSYPDCPGTGVCIPGRDW